MDAATAERRRKGLMGKIVIQSTNVQKNYALTYMGVDKMDQLMGSYSISRKTSRWYNRLIFWMLDAILVCMYICCRAVPALQVKYIKDNTAFGAHYEFRVALAQELVKEARRLTPNPDDRFWETTTPTPYCWWAVFRGTKKLS